MAVAAPATRAPTTTTSTRSGSAGEFITSPRDSGRQPRPAGSDAIGQVRGVDADAVDEIRIAPALEAHAENVKPRRRRHPKPLENIALRVEHGHAQPRVIAA